MPVTAVPLDGPVNNRNSEISGLAWYGETLIMLPQYPSRVGNSLYALPKAAILAYLDGESTAVLVPQPIPLLDEGITDIVGFEGYEAIAFSEDSVYVTIESSPRGSMMGYLVEGTMTPNLRQITLKMESRVELPPQSGLENYSDESVLITSEGILTFYEANGVQVNSAPVARLFATNLLPFSPIPFPHIEYRITDVTALDGNGRFWAINYLFPGDRAKLQPDPDPLVAQFGVGPTHANSSAVERLVEFQYSHEGITLSGAPPLQLTLLANGEARNWEGIVRLDDRGFLLMTDRFPETILAFVPQP